MPEMFCIKGIAFCEEIFLGHHGVLIGGQLSGQYVTSVSMFEHNASGRQRSLTNFGLTPIVKRLVPEKL